MGAMKNNLAKSGAAFAVVAAMSLATTADAEAAMMMRLTQGANQVVISDGGAGDANGAVGAITFVGSLGNYTLNVSTGLSKPVLGSAASAQMDLNSVNTSTGGGTLVIELTDTDFLPFGVGRLRGHVGGTTRGTASFSVCKNASNAEFDCVNPAAQVNLGPFVGAANNPLAFQGTGDAPHSALGFYSMTLIATITHGAGQGIVTSFDFDIDNVPEPASLALFGLGLLGAGAASRMRRKKNVA